MTKEIRLTKGKTEIKIERRRERKTKEITKGKTSQRNDTTHQPTNPDHHHHHPYAAATALRSAKGRARATLSDSSAPLRCRPVVDCGSLDGGCHRIRGPSRLYVSPGGGNKNGSAMQWCFLDSEDLQSHYTPQVESGPLYFARIGTSDLQSQQNQKAASKRRQHLVPAS